MNNIQLNQETLVNITSEFSNALNQSQNVIFNGTVILLDNLNNLVYLSKEEIKKAIDCNIQLCFVSKKTIDCCEEFNGKHIVISENNLDTILKAMDNDIYNYPICISPLYEETSYKPKMIKKILENL